MENKQKKNTAEKVARDLSRKNSEKKHTLRYAPNTLIDYLYMSTYKHKYTQAHEHHRIQI